MRLQQLLHKTIVITHDFLEALRLADRIAIMKDGRIVQIGTPAEVVMQPADDYVEEFTQDVPRVKVITAGDIMRPAGTASTPPRRAGRRDPRASHARFGDGLGAVAVTNDSGTVVGEVTPQAVLAALASEHDEEARMTDAARDRAGSPLGGPVAERLPPRLLCWFAFAVFAVLCLALRGDEKWLVGYPRGWEIPLIDWLEAAMDWFTAHFKPVFRFISDVLEWPMKGLLGVLHWLPWPATIGIVAVVAYAAKGWRLAGFCTPPCSTGDRRLLGRKHVDPGAGRHVGAALPPHRHDAGPLGFQSRLARRVIEPMLDVMQTVPTFAYLVPILILFGIGPVVGMVASAIYASPPVVRNVMLGLGRVPDNVIESGQMSGCNGFQLLFLVRIPAATHTIMIGVNQTIMAALSMVIIAAIIAASPTSAGRCCRPCARRRPARACWRAS